MRVADWLEERLQLKKLLGPTMAHPVPRRRPVGGMSLGAPPSSLHAPDCHRYLPGPRLRSSTADVYAAWNTNYQQTLGWFLRTVLLGLELMVALMSVHMIRSLFRAYKYRLTWIVGVSSCSAPRHGFTVRSSAGTRRVLVWASAWPPGAPHRRPLGTSTGGPIIRAGPSAFLRAARLRIPASSSGWSGISCWCSSSEASEWPMPGRPSITPRTASAGDSEADGVHSCWPPRRTVFGGRHPGHPSVRRGARSQWPQRLTDPPDPDSSPSSPSCPVYRDVSHPRRTRGGDRRSPRVAVPVGTGERAPAAAGGSDPADLIVLVLGILTYLGAKSPWSPVMDAWSGTATPIEYVKGRSPLELQGALVFQNKQCRNCHSLGGEGGRRGPALDGIASRMTRDLLIRQVLQGGGNMPAYGKNLAPSEVTALVAFLDTLRSPHDAAARSPVPPPRAGR